VVWVIRKFRPDIVLTRFSPEDTLTHGHHTASSILAREGFAAANDPKRFQEQLGLVKVWQPTRLVWNTSPFFFQNRNIPFDPAGQITLEAGGYNPLLGSLHGDCGGQRQRTRARVWAARPAAARGIFQAFGGRANAERPL
jgi:hypothetical protein